MYNEKYIQRNKQTRKKYQKTSFWHETDNLFDETDNLLDKTANKKHYRLSKSDLNFSILSLVTTKLSDKSSTKLP